jgi:hypothetical protein
MSSRQRPTSVCWLHLRAVLVALHVVVVVAVAVPAPQGGMDRRAWNEATVQAEFAAWGTRLRAVGVPWTDATLQEHLWNFAAAYMAIRQTVLAPAQPYTRYLGTGQSWRMFVAPHRTPSRLEVAVKENDAWRVIYLQTRPGADWSESLLEHDRTRSVLFRYAWPAYRGRHKRLSTWLARRAVSDLPEASHVRVRWLRQRTPSPAEARSGKQPPVVPHGERIFSRTSLQTRP